MSKPLTGIMNPHWQNSYFISLYAAAILHGLYLIVILLSRSTKTQAQSWLAVALLGLSALMVNYFVYISDVISDYPHLLNVFVPLTFLTGPALYLFIRHSIQKPFVFRWYHLLHLIPLLWALGESMTVYQWPTTQKLQVIQHIFEAGQPTVLELLTGNRFVFITAAYMLAALVQLSSLRKTHSGRTRVNLKWLQRFCLAFLSLLIFSLCIQVLFVLLGINGAYMELSMTLLFSLAVHVLGYQILRQQGALPWVNLAHKYQSSPLSASTMEDYKTQLLSYLELQRPWLNSEFSMADLSEELEIPRHHLSQVLSEAMQLSFTDLVNSYRIEEAKAMLSSGALEKYSMMGIAMECGFASKSTFNRTFKKLTGLTPTAYLAQPEMPVSRS